MTSKYKDTGLIILNLKTLKPKQNNDYLRRVWGKDIAIYSTALNDHK